MYIIGLLAGWVVVQTLIELSYIYEWITRPRGALTSRDRGILPKVCEHSLPRPPRTKPIYYGRLMTRPMSRVTPVQRRMIHL